MYKILQTDRPPDRPTDRPIPVYPHKIDFGGIITHKIILCLLSGALVFFSKSGGNYPQDHFMPSIRGSVVFCKSGGNYPQNSLQWSLFCVPVYKAMWSGCWPWLRRSWPVCLPDQSACSSSEPSPVGCGAGASAKQNKQLGVNNNIN